MHINQLRLGAVTPTDLRLGTVPVERAYLGDVLVYGEQDTGPLTYPALVLTHSPLLYWRLGDATGTTATDSSAHGRDGSYVNAPTLGNPPLLAGDSNASVHFDNTQNERAVAAYSSWMDSAAITITCLHYYDDNGLSLQALASRYYEDDSNVSWVLYREGGEYKFSYQTSGGQNVTIASGVVGQMGQTYYIAAYAGTSGAGICIYASGVLVGQATGTAGAVNSSARPFVVAGCDSATTRMLTGALQEVAYFGVVVAPADLDALAALATTPQPQWLNRSAGVAPRNGTAAHTLSFTTATSGSLLVAVVSGSVTLTATTPNWAKRVGAVDSCEAAVFTCAATGGENSLTLSHNGANYPINYVVYEFPAGTLWVAGASNPSGAAAGLSSLPGTLVTGFSGIAMSSGSPSNPAVTANWGYLWTDDYDTMTSHNGTTDGIYMTMGWRPFVTSTSINPGTDGGIYGSVYELSSQISTITSVTFAIALP